MVGCLRNESWKRYAQCVLAHLFSDFTIHYFPVWIEGKRGDAYLIPCVDVSFDLLQNTDHATIPGQPVHQAGYDVRITHIDIDYVFHTTFHSQPPETDFLQKRYRTSHWELLASTLSTLPQLREVKLGLPHPSTPNNLLKAHGSTIERLLRHDRLTVKCYWTEHKYDPVDGCMVWVFTKLDVKAKVLPEVQHTTVGASDMLEKKLCHFADY